MRTLLLLVVLFLYALPAPAGPVPKAELQALVQQLTVRDDWVQQQATNRLIALNDPRAVPLLTPLCRNPRATQSACKALAHLGKPGVEVLLALRTDTQKWVRMQALGGLGWSKDPRAIAAVKSALQDTDAEVRCRALFLLKRTLPYAEHRELALTMLSDDAPTCRTAVIVTLLDAIPKDRTLDEPLLALANDPSARVCHMLLDAYSCRFDPRLFDAMRTHWLLSEDIGYVKRAVNWYAGLGDARAVPLLRQVYDRWIPRLPAPGAPEATEDPDKYVPGLLDRLTQALAAIDDAAGTDFLYSLTKDPHPLIRKPAAWAFLELVEPRAPEVMAAVLRDPDEGVRDMLTQCAYRFGDHHAVQEALRAMCTDADPKTRERGLQYVHFATPDEALHMLKRALADPDDGVRAKAIERLACVKDPRAVDRLLAMAASPDQSTYRTLLSALCNSGDARAVDLLLPLLHKPSVERQWVLIALQMARISDRRLDEALLALLPQLDCEWRYYCYRHFEFNPTTRATGALLQALARETDNDLRRTILEALSNAGDPAAADALLAFIQKNEDPSLLQQAYGALGRTRDPRALPILLARMKAPGAKWGVIRGLGQYQGAQVYDALLPLTYHPKMRYREHGLYYLSNTGDPRTLPVLIAALKREEISEVLAAAAGLQFLGPERAAPAIDPLIAALARMRRFDQRHGVATALKALTGEDFGVDAVKWQAWRAATSE
jgi:HEAT repeat protein